MSRKKKGNGRARSANAGAVEGQNGALGSNAKNALKSFVERVERIEEEITGLRDDIKDIFAEARNSGFDTAAIRQILREKKMDPAIRAEREALCDTYRHALGMLADLPLGTAAILREAEERRAKDAADKEEQQTESEGGAEE
jgi:uncharacterized protein (UPF0335 family)